MARSRSHTRRPPRANPCGVLNVRGAGFGFVQTAEGEFFVPASKMGGAFDGDVVELACNLDDMTGEGIAFAMERLLEAGALDVYTLPIGMKKSRPGVMLCVLCREEQREDIFDLVHLKYRKHVERKKESIYWTYHNGSSVTKSGTAEDAEAQGGTA